MEITLLINLTLFVLITLIKHIAKTHADIHSDLEIWGSQLLNLLEIVQMLTMSMKTMPD